METRNYLSELNEYAKATRAPLKFEGFAAGPGYDLTHTQWVVFNGKVYPNGVGKNKKEAKHNAAKNALEYLLENRDQNTVRLLFLLKRLSGNLHANKDRRREGEILLCYSAMCLDNDLKYLLSSLFFNKRFFYKLMIDKRLYPEGEGGTVKEAKRNAARLAWSALQEQSDWDSKVFHVFTTESDNETDVLMSRRESLESSAESRPMGTGSPITSNPSRAQVSLNLFKYLINRFTSEFDPMELLGRGAFGRVYKAKHKMLNNVYYAVKVVRCEEKSLREMGTLSELLHPNIVRYYTFWVEDSGYRNPELLSFFSRTSSNSSAKYFYIQMELCDTKTLKHWIVEKNKESLQDSKRREEGHSITEQIVSAVEYIHSKRHVHRDLKPENILFGLDGKAKIGDFGLVTQDDDGDDNALMERSRERGTHSYMAPEQREKKYDRKVDIFALGLIYFEILWKLSTGHERAEVWNDARSQKLPEMFSQTFPLENQIIKSMLHQKPEDRPEASELKAKMEICAQIYNTQNVHLANATA
uniref:non-specific serine/threonine protein kinase n=1 Tax=Gasterosteus aculeatus aculeatus TaxID=481459 RepID=A0AAQ4RVE6_GASAC